MSVGKYLSLAEVRTPELLKRFCKEHPSRGDKSRFFRLLNAMAKSSEAPRARASESASVKDS